MGHSDHSDRVSNPLDLGTCDFKYTHSPCNLALVTDQQGLSPSTPDNRCRRDRPESLVCTFAVRHQENRSVTFPLLRRPAAFSLYVPISQSSHSVLLRLLHRCSRIWGATNVTHRLTGGATRPDGARAKGSISSCVVSRTCQRSVLFGQR